MRTRTGGGGALAWRRATSAGLLLEMIVPKFSDGGAVFVLERGHGGNSGQVVTRRLASRFVERDGRTHVPALPAGMPVGLGIGLFGQLRIKLSPGAVLALYTDGLVDSRTLSFERGVLALRAAISGEHGALADTCDSLIESLHHGDDVTVMLARIPG